MGIVTSFMKNDPDPITGLTPKDKYLVVSSWNIVKRDLQKSGIELFKIFFRMKPEYKNLFPFRDIPENELYSDPKLRAHAIRVMYAITYIVDSLDDSTILIEILKNVGTTHSRRPVPPESFEVLKKTVLELLAKELGSKITKEGLDAWEKTLTVGFKVILDELKNPQGKE